MEIFKFKNIVKKYFEKSEEVEQIFGDYDVMVFLDAYTAKETQKNIDKYFHFQKWDRGIFTTSDFPCFAYFEKFINIFKDAIVKINIYKEVYTRKDDKKYFASRKWKDCDGVGQKTYFELVESWCVDPYYI